jgi:hypothetical protein
VVAVHLPAAAERRQKPKSTPKSRQQQHAASIGRYLRDTNLQRMAHLQVTTGFVHTPSGGYE